MRISMLGAALALVACTNVEDERGPVGAGGAGGAGGAEELGGHPSSDGGAGGSVGVGGRAVVGGEGGAGGAEPTCGPCGVEVNGSCEPLAAGEPADPCHPYLCDGESPECPQSCQAPEEYDTACAPGWKCFDTGFCELL